MTHASLFSGIGGFDLAAEWMGWENIFHCEIAEFPRKILKYHFPKSICYEDIKKTDFTKHQGEIDIISGGFPCQPYSNAGQRRGKEDDRHLWPEMLRVIREIQPRFVVGENVAGLLSWNNGMVFHEIITDLENEGYETQAFLIPACATNAPHRRDRVWFVAHSNNARIDKSMQFNEQQKEDDEQWREQLQFKYRENGINGNVAYSNNGIRPCDTVPTGRMELEKLHDSPSNATDTDNTEQGNNLRENIEEEREIQRGEKSNVLRELRSNGIIAHTSIKRLERMRRSEKRYTKLHRGHFANDWQNFPTESPICGGDDGIPDKLHGITFPKWRNESIKGYGNAVVPQVVYQIFKAIEQSIRQQDEIDKLVNEFTI